MKQIVFVLAVLWGAMDANAAPLPKAEIARNGGKHRFWPAPAEPVTVLGATLVGGPGTEFFVGGGFQADGTVILVGNSLGPKLGLAVSEKVLGGTDQPAPPEPQRIPAKGRDGRIQKDATGQPVLSNPSWSHEAATVFAVRCSPDLKQILSVIRLPWKSAAATSAFVGEDGAVYIAGRTGATFDAVWKSVKELPTGPVPEKPAAQCERVFVARLAPDLAAVDWIRVAPGPSCCPELGAVKAGAVAMTARDWYVLDAKGEVVRRSVSPMGLGDKTAVNPTDGSIARGGCWMQHTGREPYRNPYLLIYEPDGKLRYHLYNADSHYVGMDILGLVSDSELRLLTYDRDGNLLFYAWSDGGNSVMTRLPADVKRMVPFKGVGLNAAGAGATSLAYLVRLDPRDFQVIGWTFWSTVYGDGTRSRQKANGIGVDAILEAADDSICISGGAVWGLVRTPDHLNPTDAEPAGQYVAIFNSRMDQVRFCTALPGFGMAEINDKSTAVFATGVVKGQARLLLLGGAQGEADVYGKVSPLPTVKPMQAAFGGGLCDGYVMLLDLGPVKPAEATIARPPESATVVRLSYTEEARRKSSKETAVPANGTKFHFLPTYPKHETVDAEFRDAGGKTWPSLLYGKPESGMVELNDGALKGSLAVVCDKWNQTKGLQHRRVLGELLGGLPAGGAPPVLRLSLELNGELRAEAVAGKDGKPAGEVTLVPARGTLELGTKSVKINPKVTVQLNAPGRDAAINPMRLTAWFVLKGKDLGLKQLAEEEIDVRISFTGGDQPAPPVNKKAAPKAKKP